MSDRSNEALRERLELAKKATPEGENTLWMVDGAVRGDLCIRDAFNERLLTMEDSIDRKTARHIAASSPDVVRADLEEILALRSEVARLREENEALKNSAFKIGVGFSTKANEMRAREEWLAEQVAIFGNPFCVMSYEHECEFCDIDSCRATIKARAECWRKLADMATRENPGISGNLPENEGEAKR